MPANSDVLATFTLEQVTAINAASAPLAVATAKAERAAMRLQGAKADLMDAEDAFREVFEPICAAHGLDPKRPVRMRPDGTVVAADGGCVS